MPLKEVVIYYVDRVCDEIGLPIFVSWLGVWWEFYLFCGCQIAFIAVIFREKKGKAGIRHFVNGRRSVDDQWKVSTVVFVESAICWKMREEKRITKVDAQRWLWKDFWRKRKHREEGGCYK